MSEKTSNDDDVDLRSIQRTATRLGLFFGGLVLVPVLGIALMLTVFERFDPNDRDILLAQGDEIRDALESYRSQTGAYPRSLARLDGIVVRTRYGKWKYSVRSDGAVFDLVVGNYGRNLFELRFRGTGDSGVWHWDT